MISFAIVVENILSEAVQMRAYTNWNWRTPENFDETFEINLN